MSARLSDLCIGAMLLLTVILWLMAITQPLP